MLKNELDPLSQLVLELPKPIPGSKRSASDRNYPVFYLKLEASCLEIRKAFTSALFSNATDFALRRYFNFHLKGILEISNIIQVLTENSSCPQVLMQSNSGLLSLIDFIQDNCSESFDLELYAPFIWQERVNKTINVLADLLLTQIKGAQVEVELKSSVISYLAEILQQPLKPLSFGSLLYYTEFIDRLSWINLCCGNAEFDLSGQLLKLNFNHLQFLVYLQNSIREKAKSFATVQQTLDFLRKEQQGAKYLHSIDAPSCFPQWPPLNTMLGNWLSEEIVFFEKQAIQEASNILVLKKEKICLDLPVAYIACLVKVFQDENIFVATSLSEVFRFVARNYSSKRQPVISAAGLSKEYYSINQVTAARVQDLLKKMVQRINRNFFPLLVVVSSIGHVLKGVR